ncbi:restriction endonuclease subunit S [Faecalibacterium prausnitzii]
MAKLGDICFQITDGSHNPPAGIENSKHLMLSSKNINDDEITTTAPRFLTDEQFDIENKRTNVLSGDLLMTIVGTVGRVAVVPEMLAGICLQRSVAVIKPNPTIINNRYLMYQLQSMRKFLESEARGVAQKGIYLKQVGDLSVITPPLDEQYRVVDTLDHISGLIHIYQQQLTKLDELIKARFVEMFGDPDQNPKGWPLVSITEIIRDKASNGFFAKRDAYKDDGNVQILGVSNVVNRMYSNTKELPRTDATQAEKEKYSVKYGDMLFCRSSLVADGIGKASIVAKGTFPNVLFECHVIRLSLDLQKCVPEFVQVLSTTPFFRRQIIAQSKTATMTTIGQDGILKSSVVLPPIDLQNQFADFVAEVDKSKVEVQKALDQTQLLFDSLMQQYFG